MANNGKYALGLEETILIWGSLMNVYLKWQSAVGKAWEFEMERPGLKIFVSYCMCYCGPSYLSSLILSLSIRMGIIIISPLTIF